MQYTWLSPRHATNSRLTGTMTGTRRLTWMWQGFSTGVSASKTRKHLVMPFHGLPDSRKCSKPCRMTEVKEELPVQNMQYKHYPQAWKTLYTERKRLSHKGSRWFGSPVAQKAVVFLSVPFFSVHVNIKAGSRRSVTPSHTIVLELRNSDS